MASKEKLNFGIVGACTRGKSFKTALDAVGAVRVRAVCDINEDGLEEARVTLGADEAYADYAEMLQKADLDAVVVATPMPLHVPQAIAALEKGMHVCTEVPASVSVEESRELVRAANASDGTYMMAENYTYTKPCMLIAELVRQGLFGTTYYGEGEYLHELKELNEITRWRRRWQTGVNGITYPSHSLGPLLHWMPGERVTEVCCAGSGHHYIDPRGDEYEMEDSCVMLGRMSSGGLVKIRLDMLSERPHSCSNYQLQGTKGAYESARGPGQRHRIWLAELHGSPAEWHNLEELEDEYLPRVWREASEEAKKAGHGGGDYMEILDFVNACLGVAPPPVGIHEAMDMTLPGLVSQQSIQEDGRWLPVPDSREW